MISYPLYHTKPQYLWCHIHFRHDITTPVSDIAHTLSFSCQPLQWNNTHFWMTSHPPSVWHHIHYIWHHTQFFYHHTTVLMTSQSLYRKSHPVCSATYTIYMRHHSHYLCPHTHCIDNITPTLCMMSHSPYVWHCFPYTRHHILTSWPQTTVFMSSPKYIVHRVHCICVIASTVLMTSHQLHFWDYICYNSRYLIHCIQHNSHCMTSQPLHSWHQIPYIWHHLQGLCHLVPYTCNVTDIMFVNICQLYLSSNTQC